MIPIIDYFVSQVLLVLFTEPALFLAVLFAFGFWVIILGFILGYFLKRFTNIQNPDQIRFIFAAVIVLLFIFSRIIFGNYPAYNGIALIIDLIAIACVYGFWRSLKHYRYQMKK